MLHVYCVYLFDKSVYIALCICNNFTFNDTTSVIFYLHICVIFLCIFVTCRSKKSTKTGELKQMY